jgi:small-conductance mechanosensitive channel
MDELRNQLENAQDQLGTIGIGLLQMLVVVSIAAIVARWLRRRIRRRLKSTSSPVLEVVAENSAAVGVYIVALTIVLALWGVTWAGLVTALSIGTIAAAFGFQDFLRSIVGGVLVLIEQPFTLGDRIKVRDIEGRVDRIDLRTTIVLADNGDRIAVPNALVFSDPVINRSPYRVSRVLTVTGISGTPTELKQRALEALSGLPGLAGPPAVTVRTRKDRLRVRRAVDVLPGVDLDDSSGGSRATGVGLRIALRGDLDPAMLEEAKRRLQTAFPDGRVGP